jgi:hypothetical protein
MRDATVSLPPRERASLKSELQVSETLYKTFDVRLSRVLSPAACADRHQARIGRTKRLRQAVLHGRRIGQPVLWDIPACVLTELGLRAGLRGVYLFAVTALRLPSQHGASAGFMRLRATRRDLPRYAINARNEGVRGSSPRVGFAPAEVCGTKGPLRGRRFVSGSDLGQIGAGTCAIA